MREHSVGILESIIDLVKGTKNHFIQERVGKDILASSKNGNRKIIKPKIITSRPSRRSKMGNLAS